jgi:hypothetical protein
LGRKTSRPPASATYRSNIADKHPTAPVALTPDAIGEPADPPRMPAGDRAGVADAEEHFVAKEVLGPPALIDGEEAEDYDTLLAQISYDVRPCDTIEAIWVRDVVDLVWQIRRLRRLEASLVVGSSHLGVEKMLNAFVDWLPARDLSRRWAAGDAAAVTQVDGLIAAAGHDREAVTAQTLASRVGEIDSLDRMITRAMIRRDAIMTRIARYRVEAAEEMRRARDAAAAIVAQTRNASTPNLR